MNSPSKHTQRTFTGLALMALLLALLWPALSAYALNWVSQTSNTPLDLNGVAYDDSQCQFVVVGADGTIITSPDGVTWTPQTPGTTATLNGVAYDGDSQLVVVGANGTIITSPDGVNWTDRTTGTATLHGVAYGGGQFVAVGNKTILTSPDGVTWTKQISGTTTLNGVAYGGSQFVAVGAGGMILTSPDGVTWTDRTTGGTTLNGVVYDGSQFVAVGNGKILISLTGQTWTPIGADTRWFTGIAYGSSQFAVVTNLGVILTSSDLEHWTQVADAGLTMNGVTYGGSQFVAVGDSDGDSGTIYTSGGGICLPTLKLTKSVSPSLAAPGQAITYTIAFTNTGAITATNIQITDTLSADLTNASVSSSGVALTQVPGSRYGWTAPDLPQNDGGVITITGVLAKPLAAGTLPNTVTLAVSGAAKTANVNLHVLNVAPDANAGLDQNQSVNSIVTLDGRGSTDDNGDALTYGWTQTVGTEVTFTRDLSLTTFTAPISPTVLIFTLTVTDTGGLSDTDEAVVVTVLPSYMLTVATAGNGTGSMTPAVGTHTYMSGTVVSLTATANTSSTFAGWSGDLSGSVNPTTITMTGDQSITATFNLITYTLAVTKTGTGTGTVTTIGTGTVIVPTAGINCGTDCTEDYTLDATVTLNATADSGSAFAGWAGCDSVSGNQCTVTMTADKTVTATFNTPLTGVVISGPTTGTVNTTYTFAATASPITATLPITYVWQATDQMPVTHTDSVAYTDTTNFNWSMSGAKSITVTASNADGVVTATHTITLNTPRLYLAPAETSVAVTQMFTVEIKADTGGASADTLDAYLDFDPTVLQVVDAAGVPVSAIEPNLTALPNVTWNVVSNTIGHIDFSASKMTPPPLSGTFTAATIRFKATAVVSSTSIALVRSSGRWSDLQLEGEGLTSDLSGAVVHSTLLVLPGRVALEKRGLAGDPRWITPLYRISSTGVVTGWVRLYQPGTSNLAGVYSTTTDTYGQFTVTLNGLSAGVYDIQVKGGDTLSNKRLNVSLPAACEINFGTLRVGDANGDDRVNGGDVSYMIPSFTRCVSDPAYRPYADTNKDGCVNGADVSALIPNFTKAGPIILTDTLCAAPARMATAPVVASSGAVRLSLSPISPAAHVGDVLTLDVVAKTGVNRADTVDAYLDFNPAQLEVVTASGATTDQIDLNPALAYGVTVNTVDNAAGQIDFSASTLTSPSLSGTFTVATIRVRVKSAITAGAVRFAQAGGRHTDLYAAGLSLQPVLETGNAYCLYLPATPRQ